MGAASDPPRPRLAFTGSVIDRAADIRHDPHAAAALLSGDGPVLAVACTSTDVAVETGGSRLTRRPWHGDPATAVLLGLEAGVPLVAIDLDAPDASGTPRPTTVAVREAALDLEASESGLAAYLIGLMNWHRRHPHCSVCGTPTRVAEIGLSRVCPSCGAHHFPRTDPVVIMGVEHAASLLLGSRSGWPAERFSILAGFIAPGETPEEAVLREVREESGIKALDPVYVRAQAWPFPASLMLGFEAHANGGDPRPGGDGELSDVRWFPRAELIAMQHGDSELELPGEASIARWLIDRWVSKTR